MPKRSPEDIVITGCGWVTPFAAGGILQVLSQPHPPLPPTGQTYWPIPPSILETCPPLAEECRQDQAAWLAAAALALARRDARISPGDVPAERSGLMLGIALAGQLGMIHFADDVREQSARFVTPIRFPQTVGNYIAGSLARGFDIRGPNMTLANGVASGLNAIAEAAAILRAGEADVVCAGGVERLTPALAVGLAQAGVVYSDGACLFVLERAEDAQRRGVDSLATVVASQPVDRCEAGRAAADGAARIMSVAGWRQPGAVCIEDRIGRCLAALSAAAVAAGIAAAWGCSVPIADATDDVSTTPRAIAGTSSPVVVQVSAGESAERQTSVELHVARRSA